jgi:uncharacterized protein
MESSKEQNIAVAQLAINDFLKGDIQGMLSLCADDITWSTNENPDVPFAHAYKGKTGVNQFLNDLKSNVEFKDFSPEKYYGDDDIVFVKTHEAAKVKSTGKTYDHQMLMSFKIRDGKIKEFFAYVDSADQARAFKS